MLNPGHILDGKYEILKVLGTGGMGTVYLCKNNRLGNLWAIKEVDSKWKDKIDFLAEPNLLKNLNHSGIIKIIDIFHENNNLYIVEDYIEGRTLKEHVDAYGPLSSELTAGIALELCSILDYLHSFNPPIIYRDLKPSNIMIRPDNKIVLIDFGIARTYKEGQERDTVILGSKGYIAPEQLGNVQSNAQTDIYSLAATMFFTLTGKSISLPTELMFEESYPSSTHKTLVGIIQKAGSIDPKERYSEVKQIIPYLMSVVADEKYAKTILLNTKGAATQISRTAYVEYKKPKRKTKLIIIAVLAVIITASVFLSYLLSNKPSTKTVPKAAEKVETKPEPSQEPQPAKEIPEKDAIVRGILDSRKPVIISDRYSGEKGKSKDNKQAKNLHVQYELNPAASITNSKLYVSLIQLEVINKDVIGILSIQNPASGNLKLDLEKTYLIDGKNNTVKCYNPNSTNLLSIPQGTGKQELKLYFKDFDFQGSTYTLKTTLSSTENKEINLYIDIK